VALAAGRLPSPLSAWRTPRSGPGWPA
jgi:hypothetical protein